MRFRHGPIVFILRAAAMREGERRKFPPTLFSILRTNRAFHVNKVFITFIAYIAMLLLHGAIQQ